MYNLGVIDVVNELCMFVNSAFYNDD